MTELEKDKYILGLEDKVSSLESEIIRRDKLIEQLPCTVSWISKDLKYIAINNNLKNLFYDIDFNDQEVGFTDSKDKVFTTFMSELFSGEEEIKQLEYNTVVKGVQKYIMLFAQKYRDGQEAVVVGFDITNQRKLELHISHDDRLRTVAELATEIVHEIKNPLSVIVGNAELIEIGLQEKDGNHFREIKMASKILDMSDRVIQIINGLQNMARDNSNEQRELTSLDKMIMEARALLKSRLIKSSAEIRYVSKQLEMSCVEGQIIQVLVNLIGNSSEAISELNERWIEIDCSTDKDNTYIRITDSGAGIASQTIAEMFTPFYSTKPKNIGTGMGLGVCRTIVKKHGGTLEYELHGGNTSFLLSVPN